ncbi:hypothetical protein FRC10_009170 [Ceratobasidium sp. 414]|nr:hypothetical protein FRC10_009170 [Ceratobasidium sp. 414]
MLMSLADSGVKDVDVLGPPGLNHFLASMRPYTFRDPMSVKSVETPEAASFEKVYEDEFVRVFAFPVVPNHSTPELERQPTVPSKRRSSNSSLRPDSPKRIARGSTSTAAGKASAGSQNPSLDWQHPSFNPSSLTGKDADEWRTTIIRDMFPGIQEQALGTELDKDALRTRGKPQGLRARKSRLRLPKFEGSRSMSVAYLVLGPEIRGKFDPGAADALGVAKRDRGKLTKGESVTVTIDGVQTIVTPNMCMGHSETPTGLLLVDCPTSDYISSLPDLKSLETVRAGNPFVLGSVVHRVGSAVLDDPRYSLWAKGIATSECSHLMAGEDFSPNSVMFESSAYLSLTLSELDKEMFFTPQGGKPKLLLSHAPNHVTEMSPPKPPTIKPIQGTNPDLYTKAVATHQEGRSLLTTEGQKDSFAKAREQVAKLRAARNREPSPGDDFRITTLGTGSALPSKYRNELCVREYHDLEDLGLDDENGVKIVQIEGPGTKGRRYPRDDVKYSGDTMPCDTLVEAGKDVTLLIHEATMADEEIEKAQEKGHSTIGQAVDVGKRMNAKHLLLTHFSQRYPKMPVVKSGLTATALAFDYMTISTSDIWKVGCYVGALEHVFEGVGHDDDDEAME